MLLMTLCTHEKLPTSSYRLCDPANKPCNIRNLKRKELELYRGLPTHLFCSPTLEDIKEVDLRTVYPKLLIRLDHLLNVFLVERLLVKHGRPREDLLRASFEIIVLTLHLWTHNHIWAEVQGECQWIVSDYLIYNQELFL